jgi:hypothetical protein
MLNDDNIGMLRPEFRALTLVERGASSSLTAEYTPGAWVSLQSARQNFAASLGGPRGFDKWVQSFTTISPAEAYRTHNTTAKVFEFLIRNLCRAYIRHIDLGEVYKYIPDCSGLFYSDAVLRMLNAFFVAAYSLSSGLA